MDRSNYVASIWTCRSLVLLPGSYFHNSSILTGEVEHAIDIRLAPLVRLIAVGEAGLVHPS